MDDVYRLHSVCASTQPREGLDSHNQQRNDCMVIVLNQMWEKRRNVKGGKALLLGCIKYILVLVRYIDDYIF